MNATDQPILICFDGSPAAAHAVSIAGTLFGDRPALILYVFNAVEAGRVRTTSTAGQRREFDRGSPRRRST